MTTLSATACIEAPAQIVWQQLAELEAVPFYPRAALRTGSASVRK
jgi:hypothetical protein